MDDQLLRVVLPTTLLSEVDRHLNAEGSSRTRADFVREAIEQRLLELRFGREPEPEAASEPPQRSDEPHWLGGRAARSLEDAPDPPDDPLTAPRSLSDTRLPALDESAVAPETTATYPVEAGQFFLHGRDYPSLWALWWLAHCSATAPQELAMYLAEITDRAWLFASALVDFDHAGPLRVSTMFPRSERNRDSATQTFQAAAIGGLSRRRDGTWVARGPLPLWGTVGIWKDGQANLIAPTQAGLDLLKALEGLSLELPHTEEQAKTYLTHLRRHAEGDFGLLMDVLALVERGPSRAELIPQVAELDGVDPKLGDVYSQAYVARAREWGLIEPKLLSGRYLLTDRGRSFAT